MKTSFSAFGWSQTKLACIYLLKCGFLKKSFHYECISCQLNISSHQNLVGATANPPNSDDWKCSTNKRFIRNENAQICDNIFYKFFVVILGSNCPVLIKSFHAILPKSRKMIIDCQINF